MTKKELLELLKDVPYDYPIVFKTCKHIAKCTPLQRADITFTYGVLNASDIMDFKTMFPYAEDNKCPKPIEEKAIVIDAIPYEVLKNACGINIKL